MNPIARNLLFISSVSLFACGDDKPTTPAADIIADTTPDATPETDTEAPGDTQPVQDVGDTTPAADTVPADDTTPTDDTAPADDTTAADTTTLTDSDEGTDTVADPDITEPVYATFPWIQSFEEPQVDFETAAPADSVEGVQLDNLCNSLATATVVRPSPGYYGDALPFGWAAAGNQMLVVGFVWESFVPNNPNPMTSNCPFSVTAPVRLEPGKTYYLSFAARVAETVANGFFATDFGSITYTFPGLLPTNDTVTPTAIPLYRNEWQRYGVYFTVASETVNPVIAFRYYPPQFTTQSGGYRQEWGSAYIDEILLDEYLGD